MVDVLTKESEIEEACQETEVPNLLLLSTGAHPPNPAELVQSEAFQSDPPCNEGGFRVHSGFDLDGNGALDAE